MQDVFIERLIRKNFSSKDVSINLLIVLAAVVIGAVAVFLIPYKFIGLLILIGVCVGAYKVVAMRNIEFEYSLTNGYITVDKIINKSSRKRLTAFECENITEMAPYPEKRPEALESKGEETRVVASEFSDGRDAYYIVANAEKTGRTLVVLDLDKEFLDAMKRFVPQSIRYEVYGR